MTDPRDPSRAAPEADHAALTETVYSHLRAIAQQQMKQERSGHTLSATALVHEAFLRLGGAGAAEGGRHASYLFAAAEAMRRILIEHARARARLKRGGGAPRVSLDDAGDVADLRTAGGDAPESLVAFDEAFRRLELHNPAAADVVRLRYFAGLTLPEVARALGVSERTVSNRWEYARAWMVREMDRAGTRSEEPHAGPG